MIIDSMSLPDDKYYCKLGVIYLCFDMLHKLFLFTVATKNMQSIQH